MIAPPGDGESVSRPIPRRYEAPLFVVDERGFILLSCRVGDEEQAELLGESGRLAAKVEAVTLRLIRRLDDGSGTSVAAFATVSHPLLVRVRPLVASERLLDRVGVCYAVTVERVRRRNQLYDATRRFSLTRRESEVLLEILRGSSAAEIASKLHLAEGTVQGYYKRLLLRTGARNRSAMIALVLGWETPVVVDTRTL